MRLPVQVNLPKRHLRVTATSDIRQLSELPIEIFNTKLPPSRATSEKRHKIILPMGAALGGLPVYASKYVDTIFTVRIL